LCVYERLTTYFTRKLLRSSQYLCILYADTGTLYKDGSKFDSSRDRDSPFSLTLGRRSVITGWEEGLVGMCVGEKRKLIIPSGKGYGDRGSPPKIHGGATLVFEVELLEIK
jgi:FK506-binding protein 2